MYLLFFYPTEQFLPFISPGDCSDLFTWVNDINQLADEIRDRYKAGELTRQEAYAELMNRGRKLGLQNKKEDE